jgi:gluconate kinase
VVVCVALRRAWREHLQIAVGNVSKKRHAYASKNCVTDWREQKRRTREFLKGWISKTKTATASA